MLDPISSNLGLTDFNTGTVQTVGVPRIVLHGR